MPSRPKKPSKPSQPTRAARSRRPRDPLASPEFTALRAIHRSLSEGDLPPGAERSPAEDARITAFFALQELLRILDDFAHACMSGERCHLIAEDKGTEKDKDRVTVELRIEPEVPAGGAPAPAPSRKPRP
jgi:hypothetical protein